MRTIAGGVTFIVVKSAKLESIVLLRQIFGISDWGMFGRIIVHALYECLSLVFLNYNLLVYSVV